MLPTPPPNPASRKVLGLSWQRVAQTPESSEARESLPVGDLEAPSNLHSKQWGLGNPGGPDISILQAWQTTEGDDSEEGPLIAHFDTGVDLDHPELQRNLWKNTGEIPDNGIDDDGNGVVDDVHGYDAVLQNGRPQDESEHGTHTFGILAANGENLTGVLRKGRVMPIKITVNGWLPDLGIVRGFEYAKNAGATICSHSWGGGPYDTTTHQAFKDYPQALHIVAAGNNGTDNDANGYWPGNYDLENVLVVAASDRLDNKLEMSQYGAQNVDVAAPGEDIYSTVPGGFDFKSATSFAVPHVTGLAGLIASAYPDLSPVQIKDRIVFGSDFVSSLRDVSRSGGRINAASSLEDDRIPPGPPKELQVKRADSNGLTLQWKTPADDGQEGDSVRVEVRVSEQPITEENYTDALPFLTPDKTEVGESYEVRLQGQEMANKRKLYFAAKAIDNVGNRSPMVTVQGIVPGSPSTV